MQTVEAALRWRNDLAVVHGPTALPATIGIVQLVVGIGARSRASACTPCMARRCPCDCADGLGRLRHLGSAGALTAGPEEAGGGFSETVMPFSVCWPR